MNLLRLCWELCGGRGVLAAGIILAAGGPAFGQADPRFDPATGRDLANWPPSPQFQYRHMRLVMDIPDMNAPRFVGVQTLTLSPIGTPRTTVRLDAGPGIGIKSLRAGGRAAAYTHENGVLTVRLGVPIPPGHDIDLVVEYECDLTKNRGRGLTWSPAKPEGRGQTEQAPQLHSQGEAQDNHRWFPCHDFPNVKLTTEFVVTVEDGYEVCSNGRLVSKRSAKNGRTTWHWLQDKPHPFYLVTLVVGKLAVVDINPADGTSDSARPGLPMRVYTPIGTEDDVRASFASTPAMIAYFEKKFARPYPWDKYDQLIVRDFVWGGMENTSATTLFLAASRGGAGSQTDLISHELAHQWFGDLVTCKSWEHLWLNEGWASIAEALWREQEANLKAAGVVSSPEESPEEAPTEPTGETDEPVVQVPFAPGPSPEEGQPKRPRPAAPGLGSGAREIAPPTEEGRRAYHRIVVGFMRSQRAMNRAYAPTYPSLVSRFYRSPDEPIMKTDDVYAKGALVLHMLRVGLGDEVFTAGTRLYLDRFKFGCAETDDFRHCLEEASGKSLERFFDQWAHRPGLPRLDVGLGYSAGTLTVTLEQSQRTDADNPAYEFTLPLLLKFEDGTHRYEYVDVDQKKVSVAFKVPDKPAQVSVDPNLTVLAGTTVRKPLAMWINELEDPPTLAAAIQAAEHLARIDDPAVRPALVRAGMDRGSDPAAREAAVAACNTVFLRVHGEPVVSRLSAFSTSVLRTFSPHRIAAGSR